MGAPPRTGECTQNANSSASERGRERAASLVGQMDGRAGEWRIKQVGVASASFIALRSCCRARLLQASGSVQFSAKGELAIGAERRGGNKCHMLRASSGLEGCSSLVPFNLYIKKVPAHQLTSSFSCPPARSTSLPVHFVNCVREQAKGANSLGGPKLVFSFALLLFCWLCALILLLVKLGELLEFN